MKQSKAGNERVAGTESEKASQRRWLWGEELNE